MTRTSCLGTVKWKKNVYLRRNEILLIIFRHFVELPAKNLNMINSYWTTFETLTEIERDCNERQLCVGDCSSLCLILLWMKASNDCSIQKYQTCVYYWWNISSVWLLCDIMEKYACLLIFLLITMETDCTLNHWVHSLWYKL